MPLISTLGRQRQTHLHEFETSWSTDCVSRQPRLFNREVPSQKKQCALSQRVKVSDWQEIESSKARLREDVSLSDWGTEERSMIASSTSMIIQVLTPVSDSQFLLIKYNWKNASPSVQCEGKFTDSHSSLALQSSYLHCPEPMPLESLSC